MNKNEPTINKNGLRFEAVNDAIMEPDFKTRLLNAIDFAWELFQSKVALGEVKVNKEASMQLSYSMTLERVLPLFLREVEKGERATIILEMTQFNKLNKRKPALSSDPVYREIDLVLRGISSNEVINIAVEMKCHKQKTSNGNERSAHTDFRRYVYMDLERLEEFCDVDCACTDNDTFDAGVALVMADHDTFHSQKSTLKFSLTNGTKFEPESNDKNLAEAGIVLKKSYNFNWDVREGNYFLKCVVHRD